MPEALAPVEVVSHDGHFESRDRRHLAGVCQYSLGDSLLSWPITQGKGTECPGLDHFRTFHCAVYPAHQRIHLLPFPLEPGDAGKVDQCFSVLRIMSEHLLQGRTRLDR